MKKISEIYGSAKGPVYSFEFFPPKTPEGDLKLMETVKELSRLDPDFVTVTYGAGGSTRSKTAQILSEISKNYSFPTVSHFTCVGANQEQILKTLKEIRSSGIVNLMALRGDPPKGEGQFKRPKAVLRMRRSSSRSFVPKSWIFASGAVVIPKNIRMRKISKKTLKI